MRLVFDLDESLCTGRHQDAQPIEGMGELLRALRAQGHQVIIQTARGMGTSQGSVGKAIALVGLITLQQLQDWGFEYDEILFGKPAGDLYYDDKMTDLQTLRMLAYVQSEHDTLSDRTSGEAGR